MTAPTLAPHGDPLRPSARPATGSAPQRSDPTGQPGRLTRLSKAVTDVWPGSPDEPEIRWVVRNQTPWPIWVDRGTAGVFTLGPLEQRLTRQDPRRPFQLGRLIDRRQLVVEKREVNRDGAGELAVVRAGVVLALLWLTGLLVVRGGYWTWVGVTVAVVLAVVLVLLGTRPHRLPELRRFTRWTWQGLTMVAVAAVAVVLPAFALGFGTDVLRDLSVNDSSLASRDVRLEIIGRLLQLALIAVASMLPALLYFQFDAERLSTLRDRWLHNVFRIDPSLSTVSDVEAKYGRQLEEAYGAQEDGRGRLTRGRRSPLIVATIVVTSGWLLILINPNEIVGSADSNSQQPALSFTDLVTPNPSVITYAFLGAYFFGLNLVHNAYVRGDLRPKTYNAITTRIFLVVIIAWLIQEGVGRSGESSDFLSSGMAYGLAFAAGLVPRTVLHGIMERLPFRPRGGDEVAGADQLRTLDGIDLYERTRLSDEGIRTIQALAHSDLIDLFFKTRIPPPRLIDWLDQSVLQLYLAQADGAGDVKDLATVTALRSLGVRTATDFLDAVECPAARDVVANRLQQQDCGWTNDSVCGRLALLTQALGRSEWTARVRYWRQSSLTAVRLLDRRWIDHNGDLQPGDPRLSGVEDHAAAAAREVEPATHLPGHGRHAGGSSGGQPRRLDTRPPAPGRHDDPSLNGHRGTSPHA